jgi:ATP-dependent DNA helicase RecQ
LSALTADLTSVFQRRESADLERLGSVLGISSCRGCLTNYLTSHFGQKLEAPCGHCDRCRGVPAKKITRPKARKPSDEELEHLKRLVGQNHSELATPRQLARFLCGMSSPATTRARLSRNDAFGLFADLPFAEVLVLAEAFC